MIKKLAENKSLITLSIIIVLFVIASASFFLGWRNTLNSLTIKTITSTEAANSMKDDNFYSNYDENTLIVHGVISSLQKNKSSDIVGLVTNSTYKTYCNVSSVSSTLKIGEKITLVAIAATAERDPQGVTFTNCLIL
jgi:hypothetical protein